MKHDFSTKTNTTLMQLRSDFKLTLKNKHTSHLHAPVADTVEQIEQEMIQRRMQPTIKIMPL